ncbi:MAG TPA: cupin domain-containing protein [Alphaproteobacteria bacterium]|nr:cupin domain-containing protein [Alphaproteobacteria bacterium]
MATRIQPDVKLTALEERMAAYNLRGQWQTDPNRPARMRKGPQNQVFVEPSTYGVAHHWQWEKLVPIMRESLEGLTDSYTARRSLTLKNPALPRGTTHTLVVGFQIIGPGEIAWAHRHSINALRFIIDGGADVFTVVEGVPVPMEPYDLVLTPGWKWHDHHNQSGKPASWLDCLDVPFTLALNQNFYEELGEAVQDRRWTPEAPPSPLLRPAWLPPDTTQRPFRYPWRETLAQLKTLAKETGSPLDGIALDYLNPVTGGATLPTIGCRIHWLPPGFEGKQFRRTSSMAYFTVEGEGRTVVEDREMDWVKHDTVVVPNWSWCRLANRSKTEPAIVFSMTDAPILQSFGFYREETAA